MKYFNLYLISKNKTQKKKKRFFFLFILFISFIMIFHNIYKFLCNSFSKIMNYVTASVQQLKTNISKFLHQIKCQHLYTNKEDEEKKETSTPKRNMFSIISFGQKCISYFPKFIHKGQKFIFKLSCTFYDACKETISYPRSCLFAAMSSQLKEYIFQYFCHNCNNIIEVQTYLFIFDVFLWTIIPLSTKITFQVVWVWNLLCSINKHFYDHNTSYTNKSHPSYNVEEPDS